MSLDPFVQRVVFLHLFRKQLGGIQQSSHTFDHGIQEYDNTAYKRQAKERIFVFQKLQIFHLFYKPVSRPADDSLLFRPTHKNPFHESLSADGGSETTAFIRIFFRHRFMLLFE